MARDGHPRAIATVVLSMSEQPVLSKIRRTSRRSTLKFCRFQPCSEIHLSVRIKLIERIDEVLPRIRTLPNFGAIASKILAMAQSGNSETLDSGRLLREWRWLCPPLLTVIDRNAFGDLFLTDEAGRVHMIDVGSSKLAVIAESIAEFRTAALSGDKQIEWFEEDAVDAAKARGFIPGAGQCIGFSTPVVFVEGGGLDSAYIADLYEYVGFPGDIRRQIADVPDRGR